MMQSKSENVYNKVFYLVLLLYTISNVVWLILDDAPPITDSIYYIQGSQTLIQAVQNEGLTGFFHIPDLVPYRPPLHSMFGAVALLLIGQEPVNVLYMNVIWLSVTVWLLYLLVRKLVNPASGLIAALFLMSHSLVHIYLSMYETEVPMMAVIMASYYCILEVRQSRRSGFMVLLGLLLSAGMLLKWIFFFILFGPVMLLLIDLYRNPQESRAPQKSSSFWTLFLCVTLPPVIIAMPWYIYKLNDLLTYQSIVSEGKFYTVFVDGWDWRSIMYYPSLQWLKLHWIHTFVLIGVFGYFCTFGFRQSDKKNRMVLWSLFLSGFIFWLYFVLNPTNLPQKYLLPLQPLVAVGVGLFCIGIPAGLTRYAVIVLVCLFTGVHIYQDWGGLAGKAALYEGKHSQQYLEPQTGFFEYPLRPPRKFNLPHREITEGISQTLAENERPVRVFVLPWLQRFNSFFISVWFNTAIKEVTTTGVTKYNIIFEMLMHDYIVTSTGPAHREMVHRDRMDPYRFNATIMLARALVSEPEWFMESHKFIDDYAYEDRGNIIRLYQRTKPVSVEETQMVTGLMIEGLLPHPYFFDQMDVVWGKLGNTEMMNRNQQLQNAFLSGETGALEELTTTFKLNAQTLYPFERMAIYRLGDEKDLLPYSIVNNGPVLGWHPLPGDRIEELPERGTQLPFQAFPVIPYPREVVSGYFYPQMNCVSGEFLERGERLLAMAPAAGNDDPISTLRLFEMTDINFIESTSIIRQLQPLEDVPTKGNQNHGVFLSAGDVDDDGLDELIAGQSASETSVGAFSILDFKKDEYEPKRNNFVGFPPGFRGKGNVRITAADLDGDGTKELVAAADGNGFHLCAIQLNVANQSIQRFVRPTNGVVHVQPLNDWNADDPVYITAGEFDGNPENGEEILFGLDKPDTTYRIVKIQYKQKDDGTSEVQRINLLQ